MNELETPVLIVGGGGAGLSAVNFLANFGIDSLLVERHAGTSHLPKAHYINQRSMEIFRQHGMADALYAQSAPRENMGYVTFCTPLGGGGPVDRKILKQVSGLGGGELAGTYDLYGSARPSNMGQLYLEPIIRNFAEKRNPGGVRFRHEFISFEEKGGRVRSVIRDLASGQDYVVHSSFVLAADAGKTVGPMIGVNMIGPARGVPRVQIHFSADFSDYITDDRAIMQCVINPNGETEGGQLWTYLVAFGPEQWGRHSKEWNIFLTLPEERGLDHDSEFLAKAINKFLQVDVPIKVLNTNRWFQEAVIADRFSKGRVFLIGDAAHKHTPAGGLGLNSGIQDAHNVAWKIAMVLKGQASDALLATYEPERRAVVERNAAHSLLYMSSFPLLVGSMGLVENAPAEFNRQQLLSLLADTQDGAARRDRMDKVFEIARSETGQDLDIGYTYASPAIVDDGTPPAERDPAAVRYTPSTRPGSRLPHVWLRANGQFVSTHDLVPMGGWLVITGEEGAGWCEAAQRIAAERNIVLRAVRIGAKGDATDTSLAWEAISMIDSDGALLVRPDGFICYRSKGAVASPKAALDSVLRSVLHT